MLKTCLECDDCKRQVDLPETSKRKRLAMSCISIHKYHGFPDGSLDKTIEWEKDLCDKCRKKRGL